MVTLRLASTTPTLSCGSIEQVPHASVREVSADSSVQSLAPLLMPHGADEVPDKVCVDQTS